MSNQWVIVIVSLIASAFFSGLEIAFLTANKLRIELESKHGNLSARILSYCMKKQSNFIATLLVGNNIALVVFGIFLAELLTPFIQQLVSSEIVELILKTLLSTILILIAAEFIPKNLFRINPNGVLNIFALPLFIAYVILYPIVIVTIGIAEFLLKYLFKAQITDPQVAFGRIDLDNLVRESTSKRTEKQELEHEVQIFQNALDFSEIKARECMIPRTEIIAVNVNTPIEELKKKFIETRLSRILIYENTIDHIIGFVHLSELFKQPDVIRTVLLPILIVPETMPASEVLTFFIQQHKSIAIVVDEFGGTSGMLTIEDVMEEIFGEIEDEHDKEEMIEKELSKNEFIFSGRLEIDYLNEKYKFNLPLFEGYETLAGFIINNHQSIPKVNETIRIGRFVFKILAVSNTRIEQVNMRIED